MSVEKNR